MPQLKRSPEKDAQVCQLRTDNPEMTCDQIGVVTDLSRETIRTILRKNGLPVRRTYTPRTSRPTLLLPCALCDRPVKRYVGQVLRQTNRSGIVLCPEHIDCYGALYLIIDPDRHQKHRALVRRAQGFPGSEPAYETASWRTRTATRWLQQGSKMHRVLTAAYAQGLPIIERLPVDIREQLRVEHSELLALRMAEPPPSGYW